MMRMPVTEPTPISAAEPEGEKSAEADQQAPVVEITFDIENDRPTIGLDPERVWEENASGLVTLRLRKKSVEYTYSIDDEIRNLVDGIGRRYLEGTRHADGFSDVLSTTDGDPAEQKTARGIIDKIGRIVDWRRGIELADAMFKVPAEAGQQKVHEQVTRYAARQYARYFGMLREEIQGLPEGRKVVVALLASSVEVLADIGQQLLLEPGLRTAAQPQLANLYRDERHTADTRRRAYHMLSRLERVRIRRELKPVTP